MSVTLEQMLFRECLVFLKKCFVWQAVAFSLFFDDELWFMENFCIGKFTFVLENLLCFDGLMFGLYSGATFSGKLDN